jgi:hypothetical protein
MIVPKKSFSDFFIGDSGTYSLSRVQVVAWVYIIISFQVSAIIAVMTHGSNMVYLFNLILPEQVLWLLGMSSGNYLAVKKITVDEIAKNKKAPVTLRDWGSLVTGSNGLDFSKFQFLIWTLIAIFIYLLHCHNYLNLLLAAKNDAQLKELLAVDNLSLPSIDWSFIVLMGLSQGAYVAKKLIPEEKVEEFKDDRIMNLKGSLAKLDLEISSRQQLVSGSPPATIAGKAQIAQLSSELIDLQTKRELMSNEIIRTQKV